MPTGEPCLWHSHHQTPCLRGLSIECACCSLGRTCFTVTEWAQQFRRPQQSPPHRCNLKSSKKAKALLGAWSRQTKVMEEGGTLYPQHSPTPPSRTSSLRNGGTLTQHWPAGQASQAGLAGRPFTTKTTSLQNLGLS